MGEVWRSKGRLWWLMHRDGGKRRRRTSMLSARDLASLRQGSMGGGSWLARLSRREIREMCEVVIARCEVVAAHGEVFIARGEVVVAFHEVACCLDEVKMRLVIDRSRANALSRIIDITCRNLTLYQAYVASVQHQGANTARLSIARPYSIRRKASCGQQFPDALISERSSMVCAVLSVERIGGTKEWVSITCMVWL